MEELKCECGGTLAEVTLEDVDFTPFAGIRVTLVTTDGYRCSACHGETLSGDIINALLERLTLEVAKMPRRLPGDHARFLRKRLRLSQQALAELMTVDRVTVAKWEAGEISANHDLMLRAVTMGHLGRTSRTLKPSDFADAIDHARGEPPLSKPPPFVMAATPPGLRERACV